MAPRDPYFRRESWLERLISFLDIEEHPVISRLVAMVLGVTVVWTVQLCTPLGKYMGPGHVSIEKSCDQVGDDAKDGPGTDPKESLDHTEGFAP